MNRHTLSHKELEDAIKDAIKEKYLSFPVGTVCPTDRATLAPTTTDIALRIGWWQARTANALSRAMEFRPDIIKIQHPGKHNKWWVFGMVEELMAISGEDDTGTTDEYTFSVLEEDEGDGLDQG